MSRSWTTLGALVAAFVMQVMLAPHLAFFGVVPNLLLLVIVTLAFVEGPSAGAIAGFVGGLLLDLIGTGPIGAWALVLSVTGYTAGMLQENLFAEGWLAPFTVAVIAGLQAPLQGTGTAIDAVLSAKRSRLSRISLMRGPSPSVEIPWMRSITAWLRARAASWLPCQSSSLARQLSGGSACTARRTLPSGSWARNCSCALTAESNEACAACCCPRRISRPAMRDHVKLSCAPRDAGTRLSRSSATAERSMARVSPKRPCSYSAVASCPLPRIQ